MPWRHGPRSFCNRPEVVFNCNGVLAWLCHFQPAAFSPLAKRPRPCPVSVSTLQLLIAICELPANLSPPKHPPAPSVKWVIFNTVTALVMSANFSPWYNKASRILPLLRRQAAVLKFPSTKHSSVPILFSTAVSAVVKVHNHILVRICQQAGILINKVSNILEELWIAKPLL